MAAGWHGQAQSAELDHDECAEMEFSFNQPRSLNQWQSRSGSVTATPRKCRTPPDALKMASDLLASGWAAILSGPKPPAQGLPHSLDVGWILWIPALPNPRDASIPHGGPAPDRASVAPRDEAGADKEYVITWLYCV